MTQCRNQVLVITLLTAMERLTETIMQQKGITQAQIKEGSPLHQAQQAIAAAKSDGVSTIYEAKS